MRSEGAAVDRGVMIGIAVLGVALLAVVIAVVRMPADERRARIAVLRADSGLRRARAAHERLIRAAERDVARIEQRHSTRIAELDRRIVALEDPRGPRLDAFGPVTLYALRLVTPAGDVPIDGVEADVDTEGALSVRRRTTLTRLAVGGALLGPLGAVLALGFPKKRTVDGRELYLLIEAGPASCVLQVDPDAGPQVRTFAVQVNAAAGDAPRRRGAIAAELAAARSELDATREDTSALDTARAALAASRVDVDALHAVAEAERTVGAARATLAGLVERSEPGA